MNLIPVTIHGDAQGYRLRLGGISLAANCWPARRLSGSTASLCWASARKIYETSPRPGDERLVAMAGASVIAVEPLVRRRCLSYRWKAFPKK